MKDIHVLVVDDEKKLRNFVRKNLEVRGYKVSGASNGLEALAIFNSAHVDMVIMDVMMPNMDGFEAIKRIRKNSNVPIIVLSALGEEQDKIQALNLGADDYLTKPFGTGELLARVQAVWRRTKWHTPSAKQERIALGEIVINLERHEVNVRGEKIELTPTEFNLLVYFMRNNTKVLGHKAILQNVWGPEYGQETEYLRVYIGRLRQKIEIDPANPQYLRTERGFGYSFEVPGQ